MANRAWLWTCRSLAFVEELQNKAEESLWRRSSRSSKVAREVTSYNHHLTRQITWRGHTAIVNRILVKAQVHGTVKNSSYGHGRYKTTVVEEDPVEELSMMENAVESSSRHALKQLGSKVPFAVEVGDAEELTINHVEEEPEKAEDDPTYFLILFYWILFLFLIQIY